MQLHFQVEIKKKKSTMKLIKVPIQIIKHLSVSIYNNPPITQRWS